MRGVIPPRRGPRLLSRGGDQASGREVRRIKKIGMDAWKKEVQYGKRWRVEIFFSALKRTMEDVIMANKFLYQTQEAVMKIYAYFLLRKNTVVN